MSKKLLAGLVVVGGGVWYYDQNIHPIFSNDDKLKHQVTQAKKDATPSEDTNRELRKLDNKARDFGSQLKQTASKSTEDVRNKADSTLDSVKDLDLYKKWSKKLDLYGDDVKLAAEDIERKPLGHRVAAKYIEWVNSVGQTDDEKLKELASSNPRRQHQIRDELNRSNQTWGEWWSGKKDKLDDKAEQAKKDAEQKKDLWFNWGQEKKDEARDKAEQAKKDAENKKDSWLNWGQDKTDEARNKAEQAKKDAENKKDSWLNWGLDKKDEVKKDAKDAKKDLNLTWDKQSKEWSESLEAGKQRALDEYYRAKKQVEDLTKKASEKTSSALGNDNKRPEVNPDDRYLTKAKDDLQNAFNNLSKYGGDLVDQADKAIRGGK